MSQEAPEVTVEELVGRLNKVATHARHESDVLTQRNQPFIDRVKSMAARYDQQEHDAGLSDSLRAHAETLQARDRAKVLRAADQLDTARSDVFEALQGLIDNVTDAQVDSTPEFTPQEIAAQEAFQKVAEQCQELAGVLPALGRSSGLEPG